MGYNRAHQLNIDNQSPPEDDCDLSHAIEQVAEARGIDAEVVELLVDAAGRGLIAEIATRLPMSSGQADVFARLAKLADGLYRDVREAA